MFLSGQRAMTSVMGSRKCIHSADQLSQHLHGVRVCRAGYVQPRLDNGYQQQKKFHCQSTFRILPDSEPDAETHSTGFSQGMPELLQLTLLTPHYTMGGKG